MKKKLLVLIIPLLFLIGCELVKTPTTVVENLFTKYQKVDTDIVSGIDEVINLQDMTDEQKARYKTLLEKQYKNLTYEIKDETIDGSDATVEVQIEVIDYKKAINDLVFDNSVYTKETYDNEKLNRLEAATEKVTYTLELYLDKDSDGNWKLTPLTNEDIKKIQGMY